MYVCVRARYAFKHSFGRQKRQTAAEWRSVRIASRISRREIRARQDLAINERDHHVEIRSDSQLTSNALEKSRNILFSRISFFEPSRLIEIQFLTGKYMVGEI